MARHPHPARRFFKAAIPVLIVGAAFLWWSSNSLQTDAFTFSSSRLPESFEGLRIVLLSDLHGKEFGKGNNSLLKAVREQAPDLIAVTGDILDRFRQTPVSYAGDLGAALAAIAPTYFVTGNHDWAMGTSVAEELKTALRNGGVTVLSDETVPFERNGQRILLSGVDDPNGYADQPTPEDVALSLIERYGKNDFRLLLAHRNDRFASEYYRLGYDLTLSGHGHGGLFRLPFTDGLVGTNHDLFPSYTAGFYEVEGRRVLVSRGLGNSGPTFRLFNRPEIVVLTLTRG
ncbi:metallophosphoesterase [Oscillibacter sp. MSJ-2]|uniref:Metallophosphoesterase n=1 Tax=Dysosmobacter acutus TaxID=2841504 RepID=A0ABS6F9B6_9FIRM|nr:metallophosphoesterase [Dysosmobacter acutus]MBU5625899.1 metallophosphoesterase [Dysosmobacter acutus]